MVNDEMTPERFRQMFVAMQAEVGKVIVGMGGVVRGTLAGMLGDGNILLEGVPGLGKTALVKTVGDVMQLSFARIQFTPDMMPADITGTNLVMEDASGKRYFELQRGPVFNHVILADEINRATPKTQSALLEAMQEQRVTLGGVSHDLDSPFMVLATQNPIEMEGTYPLPEAQLDRFFFKLKVEYPSAAEVGEILDRTTGGVAPEPKQVLGAEEIREMQRIAREVPIPEPVKEYAIRLVFATHPGERDGLAARYVRYGASPRGAQSLVLAGKVFALLDGRYNVSFQDIRRAAAPALRHRMILSFEGEAEGVTPESILEDLLARVPEA